MNQEEFKIFKLLTGEKELPPVGSVDRRILDNYGVEAYAEVLHKREMKPEDHNGDEDPWHSRD